MNNIVSQTIDALKTINWTTILYTVVPAFVCAFTLNGLFLLIKRSWRRRRKGSKIATLENSKKVHIWKRIYYSSVSLTLTILASYFFPKVYLIIGKPTSEYSILGTAFFVGLFGIAVFDIWKNYYKITFSEKGFWFSHRFFPYKQIDRIEIVEDNISIKVRSIPQIEVQINEFKTILSKIRDPEFFRIVKATLASRLSDNEKAMLFSNGGT